MSRGKSSTRKVTFQDVTVTTIVVVIDDQPVLTWHIQADEKRCGLVRHNTHRNSLREVSMWCADVRACRLRFAASERKANICRLNGGALVSICNWLDTHESRNGLRGSSVKNGDPSRLLIENEVKSSMSSSS